MRRSLRAGESHHLQKLGEELRAEMPPRVPEKILRRRRQATYRSAFQVRMKLVNDDDPLCHLPALLENPKRVAAVEQHGCHHRDIELSEGSRQIVNVAVINARFGT